MPLCGRGEEAVSSQHSAFSQPPSPGYSFYLRTSHISQPATNTPPTNMVKQYKP